MPLSNTQIFIFISTGFVFSTSVYFMLMLFYPGLRERWLRRGFAIPVGPAQQRAARLMIGANAGMFLCMSLMLLPRGLPPLTGAWQGALDTIAQWAPLVAMGFAVFSILMFQRLTPLASDPAGYRRRLRIVLLIGLVSLLVALVVIVATVVLTVSVTFGRPW